MNDSRRWSRRLLFLMLLLVPCVLVVALGWRMLQHKRELEQQQADNRCEEAADLTPAASQQAVAATEEKLRDQEAMRFLATTPDSVSVTFADGQLEALPHGRLLYYPVALPGESAPDTVFEPGEALEHQRQDPALAAKWFEQLARQAPAPVRAGALIRAARNLRKSGQHEPALAAYSDAARLATTAIGEVPTELFARWARCDLLDQLGRTTELKTEALELRELLLEGRWRITRPVFEAHFQAASRWAGAGEPPAIHRLALSEAVAGLFIRSESVAGQPFRLRERSGGLAVAPAEAVRAVDARSTITAGGMQFTVLAQMAGSRTNALIAGPAFVEHEWKRSGIRDARGARQRGGRCL